MAFASSRPKTMYHGWNIDSGATRHMCADKSKFSLMRKSKISKVVVADKGSMSVFGEGEVCLNTNNNEIVKLTMYCMCLT